MVSSFLGDTISVYTAEEKRPAFSEIAELGTTLYTKLLSAAPAGVYHGQHHNVVDGITSWSPTATGTATAAVSNSRKNFGWRQRKKSPGRLRPAGPWTPAGRRCTAGSLTEP